MPKPKKNRKLPPNTPQAIHTWLQRAPGEIVDAAHVRACEDKTTAHLGLDKLTRLVNYLLRAFVAGDVDIRRK